MSKRDDLIKELTYEYEKDYDKVKNLTKPELEELLEQEKKNCLIDLLVNEYHEDEEEVKGLALDELEALIDDIEDTSPMHPNETFEEFMEHEDY